MKKYSLFFFYLLTIIFLETFLRLQFKETFISMGLPLSLLFGIEFASGMYILSTLSGRKTNIVISFLLVTTLSILFASQLVYYRIFRTFYIVYSVGNAGDVMEFADIALSAVLSNLIPVMIILLPVPVFLVLNRRDILEFSSDNSQKAFLLVLSILFHVLGLQVVDIGSREVNSPYNLYYNIHEPTFAVENLGLLTYIRLDVKRQLVDWNPRSKPSEEILKEYALLSSGEQLWNEDLSLEDAKSNFNIMDIDFLSLAASGENDKIRDLHRYFSLLQPSNKNEYTGMFKDYNLIFITAESFSHLAVREDITPTLYKMAHEGFNFKEFYTPIWGVSTTDGEYVATTGLLPKTGVWSFSMSKDNLMPFSMGNQLKELGYTAKAYHNHTFDYFERQLTHTNMGYKYKGVGNGLELDNSWPESDLQMMEKTIPEYISSQRFHTYYMTVSGHFIYKFGDNDMADKNKKLVDHLPYSESVRAYLATQIELDRAMEYLLGELKKNGVADKTLIVISSDHYPYGLTLEELAELSGGEVETNFELYRNSLILYAKGMEPQTVSEPASSLDILPTLLNLMGLEYDSRLLMGRDVFSHKPPLVIFFNRSFITDKGSFNSDTGEFVPSEAFKEVAEEEMQRYRKIVSEHIDAKFLYSGWILQTDYYRKVLRGN
ncbi:MAG: LTA synthase family protein [Bacillota bacterium]